uniref:Germin-like protein n=1 Tax=Oryza meridionalis TaxID=40149 RepID=A0A0E0CW44_9ORYZ
MRAAVAHRILLSLALFAVLCRCDPDLLFDYCVADTAAAAAAGAGSVLVGFADTSYRLYTQLLRAGEAFVFPRAMVHFLYNMDTAEPAVVLSGLNSQSPGAQLVPFSAFRTEPRLPDEVLKKAFKITGQDVRRIQKHLGGL